MTLVRSLWSKRWTPFVLLVLLGVISMGRQWGGEILWETDALFYQAKVEQLQGQDESAALRREFTGPHSERARRIEAQHDEPRRVRSEEWPAYSAQYYERRWLLPTLAAGLDPVLGDHSLETLSLLFYVALGPLLFLLLTRRFSRETSFAVSAVVLALPPLRDWSLYPLTDSAGLAFLIAGISCGLNALERGPRWLWPWAGCLLGLALTRDSAFLLVLAAGLIALYRRDRRSVALVASGLVPALAVPAAFGGPSLREGLAYIVEDHTIPGDTSWAFVLGEYVPNLGHMLSRYGDYVAAHPHVLLFFVIGVAGLLALAPRRDQFFLFVAATIPGYLLFLAISPAFSVFRYELVLIPAVAAGVALVTERVAARLGVRLSGRAVPHAVRA